MYSTKQRNIKMYMLRYYCQGSGDKGILTLLQQIKDEHQISYEIKDLSTNGQYDQAKEKAAYEKDFKTQAKTLKEASGRSITELRSAKHRNYYVSMPGTIALVKDGQIIWWLHIEKDIKEFLRNLLLSGRLPV
jgi:hypothetical protein